MQFLNNGYDQLINIRTKRKVKTIDLFRTTNILSYKKENKTFLIKGYGGNIDVINGSNFKVV